MGLTIDKLFTGLMGSCGSVAGAPSMYNLRLFTERFQYVYISKAFTLVENVRF